MELLADRDPEDARQLLDPVVERMMEAVHHYEGTVNQVMGDGIMALFGAPLAHEDHAVRACYAALRMQERDRRLRRRGAAHARRARADPGRHQLGRGRGPLDRQRSAHGLHRGRPDHAPGGAAWSRWPGRARSLVTRRPCGSSRATSACGRWARSRSRDSTSPWRCSSSSAPAPVRTRLPASRPRAASRDSSGATPSWSSSRRALDRAPPGLGQVVALVGEPGVGKSRLVLEFARSHRTDGWLVLESSAVVLRPGGAASAGHRADARPTSASTTGTTRDACARR